MTDPIKMSSIYAFTKMLCYMHAGRIHRKMQEKSNKKILILASLDFDISKYSSDFLIKVPLVEVDREGKGHCHISGK